MRPKFKKGYYPDLLTWKEFVRLINIRPLMTCERVIIPRFREQHQWDSSIWSLEKNSIPPLLLKRIIQNNILYLVDMSRCSRKVNDLAKRIEDEFNASADAHIYTCLDTSLIHPYGTVSYTHLTLPTSDLV